MAHTPPTPLLDIALDLTENEAVEDFGILITDELDRWQHDNTDPRCEGAVVVDFITDPAHADLLTAVLAARGWTPPNPAGCTRTPPRPRILNRAHGQHS